MTSFVWTIFLTLYGKSVLAVCHFHFWFHRNDISKSKVWFIRQHFSNIRANLTTPFDLYKSFAIRESTVLYDIVNRTENPWRQTKNVSTSGISTMCLLSVFPNTVYTVDVWLVWVHSIFFSPHFLHWIQFWKYSFYFPENCCATTFQTFHFTNLSHFDWLNLPL